MPNVHLAHHLNLNIHSLYDHVHLRKDTIGTFAETLKDMALGRSTGFPPVQQTNQPARTTSETQPTPC